MLLKTVIVEDEVMARKSLERICSKFEDLEIVASCENAEEAIEVIENSTIDLLFLDIEMPGLSGIELLDNISYMPLLVFATSEKKYAFEAFEYDVVDFLKKPISLIRFQTTLEKIHNRVNQLTKSSSFSSSMEMYIKQDGRLIRIPYSSVLFFENVGDYVKICTEQGDFIIYATLKYLDEKLTYPGFLKVHRSYIVNLEKIRDIEDNTLVINKKVIPISRAHKSVLLKTINLI